MRDGSVLFASVYYHSFLASNAQIRIAYLVSQYPAANHTFILREIMQLRRMGMDIRVASIRAADRPFERLTSDEQNEQSATFYVKAAGFAGLLAASLRVFFSRPFSY